MYNEIKKPLTFRGQGFFIFEQKLPFMNRRNFAKDILFGVAVADALGVPVEFQSREFLKTKPLTEMIGYGTYSQPPGTWSDDSSLTFCLAESLIDGYDLKDIAEKFVAWKNATCWTPHGEVFDIGNTTSHAINHLQKILETDEPHLLKGLHSNDEQTNGNGSLMRISPLLFYIKGKPIDEQFDIVWDVSALTHGHIRSAIACLIYLNMAEKIMDGLNKTEAYEVMQLEVKAFFESRDISNKEEKNFERILYNDISTYPEDTIESGGYVMHSLEASLWCLLKEKDYSGTVLRAINLGHDTDTTGAIAGGLAGLLYGWQSIPKHWIYLLAKRQAIEDLAKKLAAKYNFS